ncbi:MAG: hypothetical protein AB7W06_17340 [Alphaproteobacteria bacterium]
MLDDSAYAVIPRPVASALSHERLGIFLPIPRDGSYTNVPIEDLSPADWKRLAADQPEAGWRWAERITRLAAGQLQQLQQILLAEADLRQLREFLRDKQGPGAAVAPAVAVAVADAAGEIEPAAEAEHGRD